MCQNGKRADCLKKPDPRSRSPQPRKRVPLALRARCGDRDRGSKWLSSIAFSPWRRPLIQSRAAGATPTEVCAMLTPSNVSATQAHVGCPGGEGADAAAQPARRHASQSRGATDHDEQGEAPSQALWCAKKSRIRRRCWPWPAQVTT